MVPGDSSATRVDLANVPSGLGFGPPASGFLEFFFLHFWFHLQPPCWSARYWRAMWVVVGIIPASDSPAENCETKFVFL